MPGVQTDLEAMIRIPSCGFPGFDPSSVRESAEFTASLLRDAGLEEVRLIEVPGGHPAVFGHTPGPAGTPTVLLYAHHDVQPPGPEEEWDSPPYEPVVRDGRLYGRGSCDDKCGIAMHLASLRAFDGSPPVGVKVLVEGEEECTSEHLDFLVGEHADLLRADAVVIADSGVWRGGIPALTTSIRGVVACTVEVRVTDQSLHSGVYGGPIPDAIMSLARIITALHDDDGAVAVAGLTRSSAEGPDFTEEAFREEAGVRPGVERLGSGPLIDQLWRGPSITVIGIDAPSIQEASYQIVPVARAHVTMRIAPSEDPVAALDALMDHIRASAPWGVEVTLTGEDRGHGYEVATQGPIYDAARRSLADAWGTEPIDMGMGGSVPLVPEIAEVMPDAVILLTGPGDESSAPHSINESVDLAELERSCLAQALFLQYLAKA